MLSLGKTAGLDAGRDEMTITRAHSKFLHAAENIRLDPDKTEAAFIARQLVQATLPHKNPGDIPAWSRTNGDLTLTIRSGWNNKTNKAIGYPYGTLPRLLLFWITSEALKTQSPRIELGNSLANFMRELGLDPSRGGSRSDVRRLRDQMERLFRATISFDYQQEKGQVQRKQWLDMQVAPKGELWWDTKNPNQVELWGSWINLGEDFYNALISAPVPLDMRALLALKNSAMALDLYAWASWRSFTTAKSGKVQFIPWLSLMKQMGANYSNTDDFRRKIKATLRKVQAVYPGLKIEDVDGGLNVLPISRPSVTEKLKKITQENVEKVPNK